MLYFDKRLRLNLQRESCMPKNNKLARALVHR